MHVTANKLQSFKTVFLGDSSVGKTCLAKLYVEGQVVGQSPNTIGFDHHVKKLKLNQSTAIKVGNFFELGGGEGHIVFT